MRIALQRAFILHRRPYRDSSLLLEVFSEEHGRVGLVAKGARRAKSRTAAALQSLAPLFVSWSGKGELGTLTGVEFAGPTLTLSGERLLCVLYLNELIMRLLARYDPHPELYQCYQLTVHAMVDQPTPVLLRNFEKQLLDAIGYGLQLTHQAASGEPVQASEWYRYVLERGPIATSPRADLSTSETEPDQVPSDPLVEGILVSGTTLLALAAGRLDHTQTLRESRALLRAAVDNQLLGKPLQTRMLLQQWRRRGRND